MFEKIKSFFFPAIGGKKIHVVYVRNELIPDNSEIFDLVIYLNSNQVYTLGVSKPAPAIISDLQYNNLPTSLKKFFNKRQMSETMTMTTHTLELI